MSNNFKNLQGLINKVLLAVFAFTFAISLVSAPFVSVNAQNIPRPGGQSQGSNSGLVPSPNQICQGANCSIANEAQGKEGIVALLVRIARFLTYIGIGVAVLVLVYGGFLYITDQGKEENAKQAKQLIINAVIGLFISIIAYALVAALANIFAGDLLST